MRGTAAFRQILYVFFVRAGVLALFSAVFRLSLTLLCLTSFYFNPGEAPSQEQAIVVSGYPGALPPGAVIQASPTMPAPSAPGAAPGVPPAAPDGGQAAAPAA